jgi:thiol:disulfide interchange protein
MTYSIKPDDTIAKILGDHPAAKLLAVKFTAAWCAPCKQHPFEKVAELPLGLPLLFALCDVNSCMKMAEQYLVRSVPTVVFFNRAGQVVGPPNVGVPRPERFVELLRERMKLVSSGA